MKLKKECLDVFQEQAKASQQLLTDKVRGKPFERKYSFIFDEKEIFQRD